MYDSKIDILLINETKLDLPNCVRDAAPRMFADDTNITLSAKTVADLKLAVTSELNNITCWLRANR